ncbi:hypothetical protein F5141DRAFT_1077310 [Pisolithus sp. B1]|nr:hypothetical protein F5141DRAFT_1077310 [Pisolithus sp. B1]
MVRAVASSLTLFSGQFSNVQAFNRDTNTIPHSRPCICRLLTCDCGGVFWSNLRNSVMPRKCGRRRFGVWAQ